MGRKRKNEDRIRVNKREFLDRVATNSGIPASVVREVYDGIWGEIHELLVTGHDVSLDGYGSFSLKKHKGHLSRNVAMHDKDAEVFNHSTVMDDYYVIKFTAGVRWRARVRQEAAENGEKFRPQVDDMK